MKTAQIIAYAGSLIIVVGLFIGVTAVAFTSTAISVWVVAVAVAYLLIGEFFELLERLLLVLTGKDTRA